MATKDEKPNRYNEVHEIVRHIEIVRDATYRLANKLREVGEPERFCVQLIANGLKHDVSKLFGIEWEYLNEDARKNDPEKFRLALNQHVTTNKHHPEYWGGIDDMPRIHIAEMCCDWFSRSSAKGTDLWEFVKETAMPRFGISPQGKHYKMIKHFLDLLLEKPFVAPK